MRQRTPGGTSQSQTNQHTTEVYSDVPEPKGLTVRNAACLLAAATVLKAFGAKGFVPLRREGPESTYLGSERLLPRFVDGSCIEFLRP